MVPQGDGELQGEGVLVELVLRDTLGDKDPLIVGERVLETLLLAQPVGESDADGDTEGVKEVVRVAELQGVGDREDDMEGQVVVVGVREGVPVGQLVEDVLIVCDSVTVADVVIVPLALSTDVRLADPHMDGEPEAEPEPLKDALAQEEGLGLSEARLVRDTEGVSVEQVVGVTV